MLSNKSIRYHRKLRALKASVESGQVLDRSDFSAHGFSKKAADVALSRLKTDYGLDILTVRRGQALVGWILADEVL